MKNCEICIKHVCDYINNINNIDYKYKQLSIVKQYI